MPFYKAAVCLTYEMENPLELFPHLFPNSYFVTEQQAYDSTQNAIWKLLYDYQIPDNNISQIEHDSLAKVLLQYAERGDLLQTEPEFADIQTEGELSFSYDPEDGLWHTGKLKIIEPENYHGIYDMSFPEGVTLLDSKLSHVYGNEEYELVSSRPVQPGEIFCGTASYYWMEAYSGGKDVGAVLSELSTLVRDLLLRRTAPKGGDVLLSGGYDAETLDRLGRDVSANRLIYLATTLQKTSAELYYSSNRRTDAELCLLRLCDEGLSGDLTALEARIQRLEEGRPAPGMPCSLGWTIWPSKQLRNSIWRRAAGKEPRPRSATLAGRRISPPAPMIPRRWRRLCKSIWTSSS